MVPRTRRVFPRQAVLFLLLPALLAVGACHPGGAKDQEAVQALVQHEVQAMNARDLQKLSQVWSQNPEITLFDLSPPGRFKGWDTIGRTFNDFFGRLTEPHLAIEGLEVQVSGTLAWATYDWSISGRLDEATLEDRGRTTSIYRREKEGWKLVHEHVSLSPAGSSPTAASPAATAPTGAAPAPAVPRPKPGGAPAPQGG
jgi:ketosteroid isomerase-like protein